MRVHPASHVAITETVRNSTRAHIDQRKRNVLSPLQVIFLCTNWMQSTMVYLSTKGDTWSRWERVVYVWFRLSDNLFSHMDGGDIMNCSLAETWDHFFFLIKGVSTLFINETSFGYRGLDFHQRKPSHRQTPKQRETDEILVPCCRGSAATSTWDQLFVMICNMFTHFVCIYLLQMEAKDFSHSWSKKKRVTQSICE